MELAVLPPVEPMLARVATQLPRDGGWLFEPKWDGFRAIVFRDGEELSITSRNERSLDRYFPELRAPLLQALPARGVVDGEIVVVGAAGLDFDALSARIHPAHSRVARLATETPASFAAFDLLALGQESLLSQPHSRRRELMERAVSPRPPLVVVTPSTTDLHLAGEWFTRFEGAGFDGIVAKRLDGAYEPGRRSMLKVKHERSADAVVGGFRWRQEGVTVASLILGLYDGAGVLHHVGVTSSFSDVARAELVDILRPLMLDAGDRHPWLGAGPAAQRRPGGQSRWSAGRDASWVALRPELVAEVAYDHLQGERLRHAATFRRWRPDREPTSCSYAQLEVVAPAELEDLFRGGPASA